MRLNTAMPTHTNDTGLPNRDLGCHHSGPNHINANKRVLQKYPNSFRHNGKGPQFAICSLWGIRVSG
jgi:hypothetical protein